MAEFARYITAAGRHMHNGVLRDVAYENSYVLHGDLGAKRKGGKHPQKTGKARETTVVKSKTYEWTCDTDNISRYPLTTGADRFLSDFMVLAEHHPHLIRRASLEEQMINLQSSTPAKGTPKKSASDRLGRQKRLSISAFPPAAPRRSPASCQSKSNSVYESYQRQRKSRQKK